MFTYENGLVVSFVFYFYYLFNLLTTINSKAEKNLNKIGERHSWLTLKPKPMGPADFERSIQSKFFKFAVVALWQGLFVFLSWVNVFINIAYILYSFAKDSGVPPVVKEFRWKLRNYDLEFDEIILELMKVRGLHTEDFDRFRSEMYQTLANRRTS